MDPDSVDSDQTVEDNAASEVSHEANPERDSQAGQGGTDAGSLTQPDSDAQKQQQDRNPLSQQAPTNSPPPGQKPAVEPDWQRQYKHLQSNTDKQLSAMRKQQEESARELQEHRQFREQQRQQAEQAKLKPWSRQHPENQKFGSLLERAKVVRQQLAAIPGNLPPEERQAREENILSALTADDQKSLVEYREAQESFTRDFFQDPRGTLMPMISEIARQEYETVRVREDAQRQVAQDFNDPALKPLVEEHAAELRTALADGMPYDYAVHMLKLFAENKRLAAGQSQLGKEAMMGREQVRLAQGKASVRRDPAASSEPDIYQLAKREAAKSRIPLDSPKFMQLLARLEKQAGNS